MIFLVGNWKMAPEKNAQAIDIAKKTLLIARTHKKTLEVMVCPSFIHIPAVSKVAKQPLFLGAQTVSGSSDVPNTGLVSAAMLKDAGIAHCIVGHSEARMRGETNEMVRDEASRLIEKKISPIVCVGEHARDGHGWYLSEVKDQLESFLAVVPKAALKSLVIAYEPVWAIGKDAVREATPAECREMIMFIRKLIADMHGEKIAASVRIIYGGSVNEANAASFITEGGAQGLLVGRVSLEPKRFALLAQAIAR